MLQTLLPLFSSATVGGIIVFILQWIRYKSKDKSDTSKTDAETAKIKAEATQIEAQAQVTVADAALKLAQRLGEECDMTKLQLNKAQLELSNVTKRLEEVQTELSKQIEKNNIMVGEIMRLTEEINKLKSKDDGVSK